MKKEPFFHSTKLTLALFLVVLGLFILATEMGWIDKEFPFWSVILIAFGIFVAAGEISRR
jgi:hypothetical protein